MELHQKSLFEKKSFFLEEQKIKAIAKDSEGEVESYTDYEDIKRQTRIYRKRKSGLFWSAIFFGLFSFFSLIYNVAADENIKYTGFWVLMAIILTAFYNLLKRSYLLVDLHDNTSIFFLSNKPDKQAVDNFVKELFERRDAYIRENYFYINPDNEKSKEISRLKWLLREEVIDESEYESAIAEWDKRRLF